MEPEIYERMARIQEHHWWFVSRRSLVESTVRSLSLGSGARILAVGCGTGANLPMLTRYGTVVGVEPYEAARELASRVPGVDMVDGRLPDGLPEGPWDLAVALDVFEHVEDDRAALAGVFDALRPGGHLILTVPSRQVPWSIHDERHHHFRRYGRAELRERLAGAGFEIGWLTGTNVALLPLVVGFRTVKNALGLRSEDDEMPSAPMNVVLKGLSMADQAGLGRVSWPVGTSWAALVRRPD